MAARKDAPEKPILLKIAPDLTDSQLLDIIDIVSITKIDGIIATNTTISRENLKSHQLLQEENGDLSGAPLKNRSTEVIRFLAEKSNKAFPIIGVGGINSAKDALEKLDAGADLIQLFIWTNNRPLKHPLSKGLKELRKPYDRDVVNRLLCLLHS